MPTASPYQPRSSEKYGKRQLGALDRHTHEFDIIPAPTQEVSTVRLAVVGAHMKGLSLHHELEEVEAQFYGYSKTSPHYKLFCLKEQSKPGLVRVNTSGYSIQVEVYTLPLIQLGFFLTKIKPPLTLGTIELAGGEKCFGFLCESYAGTHDISSFGGWRNYLNLEGSRVEVTRLFSSVLVANRGEIAVRCIKTLKKMGIRSIAVYTEPDQFSMHVKHADEAISIRSYTDMDDLIKAAQGAEAIFSGYGFLSESPTFAAKCEESGKTFIGPTSSQIQAFALKHTARTFADRAKVPRIPGSKNVLESLDDAIKEAKTLGYPCLLKSTAGGGGIGLHVCESEEELRRHYSSVNILAQNFFNDGRLFLEKYIPTSRHVEVQIFGDGKGKVICLGDRDCSMQRRHQKIIEECPAPGLSEETRKKLYQASVSLLELVDYRGPGTVEFLYRHETQEFFFLEVNTRLQVEHPITEMVHGIDLVEWMIQIACGIYPEKWTLDPLRPHGHAIEARIYAENPVNGFSPSTGVINELKWPLSIEKGQDPDSRVDTWVEKGTEITMNFDPLLAKFIVKGKDRSSALEKLKKKLSQIVLSGIHTNLLFLQSLLSSPVFAEVKSLSTTGLNNFDFHSFGIQVLEPGIQTTIQDYPGRIGYWDIGVPPSGPMDPYAFQMANALVGNDDRGLSGLECVIRGPTIKFQQYSIIAITGPIKSVKVSGKSFASWTPIPVKPGDVVEIGNVNAKGCRVYLAFYGGLKVPKILNSASTFMLGKMGGNANGRPLIKGDWLTLNELGAQPITHLPLDALHPSLLPTYSNHYTIAVMMGPHSAPDYLTPQGIETFLSTHWTVDYNSNRLGIRFNGSKPLFTRRDGGEAGLHPSNIHDCPYAIGSINLSGDVPALLTVDGPSLGGFICPVTVCQAEFWKVGQLRPGHTVEFQLVSYKQANILLEAQRGVISQPPSLNFEKDFLFYEPKKKNNLTEWSLFPSILRQGQTRSDPVLPYMIRQAGDEAILIEFGDRDADFDMFFRFYVQAFCLQLETHKLHEDGIGTLVTGVRSVQVQFHRPMNQAILLKLCALILSTLELPATLPSRIVYLPFYFDDPYSKLAVERYMETVVSDAPWLPSNIEFLRRANGLDNHLEVRSHILDSTYLVLGLGDVYLGSPCAVPLDPKHRLLGTKYSPARTYTPEGSVGIGGMYMCIYGMEGSPGGYQLVGRTLPIWQQHLQSPLLQCFDQIRFFLVEDKEEFEKCRKNAAHGLYQPYIQSTIFSLSYYQAQTSQSALLSAGKLQKQLKAFEVEVDSWKLKTNDCNIVEKLEENEKKKLLTNLNAWNAIELAQHRSDIHLVKCNMASRVWKVLVQPNQRVKSGDTLVVVEAMKAEVALTAPVLGTVAHLLCKEGDLLEADQVLIILETQQDRENSTDKK
ncbi:hypothetical protein HMI54_014276 [Coelomomyces lativittatus]|nr:hypothetical protein HMI54_014276 [Coelomomyces lativittatus]